MKTSLLALSIGAAALAGTALYFRQQLEVERERSAQSAETARQLQARIAELERNREQFAHVRSSNGTVISGAFGVRPASSPPPPANSAQEARAVPGAAEQGWMLEGPAERPAGMDKMLRWQIRADNKRLYAGLGATLGLGKEKTAELIDLLTEQQVAQFNSFGDSPWPDDPEKLQRQWEQNQRDHQVAIEEFLGPEKAQAFKEYQQSLPARQEFELLVNQLEGNDVTLTPDQRQRLLAAYLEERKRVPMPTIDANMNRDPAAFHQAYTDWQNDYSERLSAEARNILDSDQLGAFNEVQEFQRQMRSQFRAMTFSAAPAAALAVPSSGVAITAAGGAVAVAAPESANPPPRDAPPRRP